MKVGAKRGKKDRDPKKPARFGKIMQKKLAVLFFLMAMALVGLYVRIIYINQTEGDKYEKIVLSHRNYDSQAVPYRRGDILDANGSILATSKEVYNLILDCRVLNNSEEKNREATLASLTECFPDIPREELEAALTEKPDSPYVVLRKKLEYETIAPFEERMKDTKKYPDIKGVWFEKEYQRSYPYSTLASDVVGFTTADNVGSCGIEMSYNETLNGLNGRQYGYLNEDNDLERTVKNPVNGSTVMSTIDINIQSIVEKQIQEFNKAHENAAREGAGSVNTAVVVMDPNSGEVLAMADSAPYDLNNPRDLSKWYSAEAIAAMDETAQYEALNRIWKNYAVSETYEPGSTLKPVTVAAALECGAVDGSEVYTCDGKELLAGMAEPIHCVNRTGHGAVSVEQSIMFSCNDVLMQIAAKLGAENFCKYQEIFNFGLKTNIDLPGEPSTQGLIYKADEMKPVDLATNSFGQNFNVTMIQTASAFCSLVNGGNYYSPHIVKKILDDQGKVVETIEPTLLKKTVSKHTSDLLKQYLYNTVAQDTGTAKAARIDGYTIGGKTGTAEKVAQNEKGVFERKEDSYLVSFIGYAPQDNPQVVVYVVIDEANDARQDQATFASVLARGILAETLPYLNVFPTEPAAPQTPAAGTPETPAAGTTADPAVGNPAAPTPGTQTEPAANTPETPPADPAATPQENSGSPPQEGQPETPQENPGTPAVPEGGPTAPVSMPEGGQGEGG